MIVIGAGMAGLMAAQMLRRHTPSVLEAQPALPSNHGALLRFRSDVVERATGIPLRRVRVLKAMKAHGAILTRSTLQDANAYSFKVTGEVRPRSILDLDPCDRFIAPDTFMSYLASGVSIEFGRVFSGQLLEQQSGSEVIISTVPMPALMDYVDWPSRPTFRSFSIGSLTLRIVSPLIDVFQTIYYPYDQRYYRASITGNRLIIEFPHEEDDEDGPEELVRDYLSGVLDDFGIDPMSVEIAEETYKVQRYGKLLPIPERERRAFILAMTEEYGIYSVGRFATWRQILLDDVVQDITLVERMITARDDYARAKLKI